MGNPAVVFTTYSINSSTSWATTNVSGHAANSTSSPFVELKSDLVPQAALFSNGDYQVSDFDLVRITTTSPNQLKYSNGQNYVSGTHEDTVYTTRGTLGTFALSGGQFELCEFDTGVKGSTIADHASKSGVSHNYVAFANTGDGDGLIKHANGVVIGDATYAVGPPTAYAPDIPFANIEYDVAHTSTPLQAIAGGGTTETQFSGIYQSGTGTRTNTASEGQPADYAYSWSINNAGSRTEDSVTRSIPGTWFTAASGTPGEEGYTPASGQTVNFLNTSTAIMENWFPQADYSPSSNSSVVHQGTIKFRVHPDSEYVMAETMTTTNVAVASINIDPSVDVGPIATHSKVTVTTDSAHGLTDDQNQIVLTGCDSPTHINGIHNVYSVTSTTVFTYEIVKSTVTVDLDNIILEDGGILLYEDGVEIGFEEIYRTGQIASGDFKLQTYDGIDKTGAVIKTSSSGSGAGIAEVVHGGCGGNNTVLLRGDTSSNISLGTQYYVYTDNTTTASIASVKFTSGPTYKSMFKEMGLKLDENTGQISSNGAFFGGLESDKIIAGGYVTLEENVTGKNYGTEFIVHEDGFGGKIETEDFNRRLFIPPSGLNELDSYFPKFKHARDYALNRVKTDGTITQTGDVVTIQGVDAVTNIILLEDETGGITTEGGYFTLGLEDGTKTFPTKYANALPLPARFKTLQYQNGFTTNVSYATSNSEFVVQSNSEITLSTGTGDGESYELTYADTSWPTTNGSSYWFLNNVENSPVIDGQSNILIFKTTSESTNFKVHFTIRAQKEHGHMGVYTGDQGTSTAASVLNTIDGWGDGLETGTGNYYDGYFYTSVYNNTDSDRDDQVVVFSDQNNASSNTLDFNGNAFKHRDDPNDPATEISILNEEALANGYSNGDFTLLTSV
jgi:hypothetical protein